MKHVACFTTPESQRSVLHATLVKTLVQGRTAVLLHEARRSSPHRYTKASVSALTSWPVLNARPAWQRHQGIRASCQEASEKTWRKDAQRHRAQRKRTPAALLTAQQQPPMLITRWWYACTGEKTPSPSNSRAAPVHAARGATRGARARRDAAASCIILFDVRWAMQLGSRVPLTERACS